MNCLFPKKLQPTLQRGAVTVPCGKCYNCRVNNINDWTFRLNVELKQSYSSTFVTLTYDHKHLRYSAAKRSATLYKRDVQLFFKRLRKSLNKTYGSQPLLQRIRYVVAGEYGSKNKRPHYHILLFSGLPEEELQRRVIDAWAIDSKPIGNVYFGDVNQTTVSYVVGYIADKEANREYSNQFGVDPQFIEFSKYLGAAYITSDLALWHNETKDNAFMERYFVMMEGRKYRMPKYYKDRIYTPTVRKAIKDLFKAEYEALEDVKRSLIVSPDNILQKLIYSERKIKLHRKETVF